MAQTILDLLAQSDLPKQAAHLYLILHTLADPTTHQATASVPELAHLSKHSPNTVRKYTRLLEERGWLTITPRYEAALQVHQPHVYRLLQLVDSDATATPDEVPPASKPNKTPLPVEVESQAEFEAPFGGKPVVEVPPNDEKSSLNLSTKSSIQEKLFQEKNEKPKKQKKPQRYDTDPDFKAFVDKFSEVTSCLIVQLPTLWRTYRADLEKLWDMQYGIQDLEAFERWWKSQDWRGMQGQQAGPRDVLHHILTARQKYKPVSVIALKERYADLIGD